MEIKLTAEHERYVREKVKAGAYASAEEVVEAGLAALRRQEEFGGFEAGGGGGVIGGGAGEMEALIEEGERSIREEGTVEAEEVFAELRRKTAARRSGIGPERTH